MGTLFENKNEYVIKSAFRRYIVPAILSFFSVTLACFLNGIIMGRSLGANGLAVFNIATPYVAFTDALSSLIFMGASVQYSILLSRGDKKMSNHLFTWCIVLIVAIGVISYIAAALCADNILYLLGARGELLELTRDYFKIILISTPIVLLSNCFVNFIRNDSRPEIVMIGVCILNFTTPLITYVLIVHFKISATGAAYGLLIGNIASIIYYLSQYKKYTFSLNFSKLQLSTLMLALRTGFPTAVAYFGAMFAFALFNNVAFATAGIVGVAIWSFAVSIIGIVQDITIELSISFSPIYSSFFGEEDMENLQGTVKLAAKYLFATILICTLVEVVFANQLALMFGFDANDPETLKLAANVLKISAISVLFYSYYNLIDDLYVVMGYNNFNSWLAALRTIILPVMFLAGFTKIFGYVGLFYFVLAREIVVAVISITFGIVKAGKDKHRLTLVPIKQHFTSEFRQLIEADIASWGDCIGKLEEFCSANNLNGKTSFSLTLLVEEMIMNICEHGYKNERKHYVDILIKNTNDKTTIRIRDDGVAFDAVNYNINSKDIEADLGIKLLKGMATHIEYNRIMGFNNLIITL